MRKLVTVRTIKSIEVIDGCDTSLAATVDGWRTFVKPGEFKAGDPCVYFEADSFLPLDDSRFNFLMAHPTFDNGKFGTRLVVTRIVDQLGQGLALPLNQFPEVEKILADNEEFWDKNGVPLAEQTRLRRQIDFSKIIGISKCSQSSGGISSVKLKGEFPDFIPMTGLERAQNLLEEIFEKNYNTRFEITTKLDGESCTIYSNAGKVGVCSLNMELQLCEENSKNPLIAIATENDLIDSIQMLGRNLAIQGEIIGPGVRGNREQLKDLGFFIFDIYDIDQQRYLTTAERLEIMDVFRADAEGYSVLKHVPILHDSVALDELNIKNIDDLLRFTDGSSLIHPIREGLVFKSCDGSFRFKAVSNHFLERNRRRHDRGG
jgi:RNA ligase (TIGR02306 family)